MKNSWDSCKTCNWGNHKEPIIPTMLNCTKSEKYNYWRSAAACEKYLIFSSLFLDLKKKIITIQWIKAEKRKVASLKSNNFNNRCQKVIYKLCVIKCFHLELLFWSDVVSVSTKATMETNFYESVSLNFKAQSNSSIDWVVFLLT